MNVNKKLSCQDFVELVTDYVEDALPAEERRRFEHHLTYCHGCVTYVDQMRETIRAVGALRAETVEATVPDDVLAAFRAWKSGGALPGT